MSETRTPKASIARSELVEALEEAVRVLQWREPNPKRALGKVRKVLDKIRRVK
ncbi:hypothetical protein IWQ49_006421 [Labrenzia sp. EL_126]|nr:hypothetical protein [Labrenzia sp. EL_126]